MVVVVVGTPATRQLPSGTQRRPQRAMPILASRIPKLQKGNVVAREVPSQLESEYALVGLT